MACNDARLLPQHLVGIRLLYGDGFVCFFSYFFDIFCCSDTSFITCLEHFFLMYVLHQLALIFFIIRLYVLDFVVFIQYLNCVQYYLLLFVEMDTHSFVR
jgi:hypothetical protein